MEIKEYDNEQDYDKLIYFMEECLPESGRHFDLSGKHEAYLHIPKAFLHFYCLFDGNSIVGTSALKELNKSSCELKSLYLLEKYHHQGWGYKMMMKVINMGKTLGYSQIYLDTISTSTNAIALYIKSGFQLTDRYNNNYNADVFMVKNL